MKAVGIIAEYNPFNNGHIYHINQARQISNADVVIAIISSNFVQRGEPAIIDKKSRTIAALNNGVDLVIELPFLYSVECPEVYAFGALSILSDLGVKDLVFGCDTKDAQSFMSKFINNRFSFPRLDELIHDNMEKGLSYEEAKSIGITAINDFYLEEPNDVMGSAYLRTIVKHNLDINPIAIPRSIGYKEALPINNYMSAQTIRNRLKNGLDVDSFSPLKFDTENLHFLDDYFLLIKYILLTFSSENLGTIHLVSDGIENLMKNTISDSKSMDEFLTKCCSKRYSKTYIKRILIQILCNTNAQWAKEILSNKPPYIRILGSNSLGRKYLSLIRKSCPTPILNRFKGKDYSLLQNELVASNVYYALEKEPIRSVHQNIEINDFPIIID